MRTCTYTRFEVQFRDLQRYRIMLVVGTLLAAFVGMTMLPTNTYAAKATKFGEMSLERWAKLREVERYQLNIAEKYFGKGDWKIAITEYEKYLKLYEASEAASYAQLRWSVCMLKIRKQNTAIRDGFQSVIDYWPDSPEAKASAFYIARTYRDMGQVSNAKKAYANILDEYEEQYVSVLAKVDLLEMAKKQKDDEAVVKLLEDLTFKTKRTTKSKYYCERATRELATRSFYGNKYEDAIRILETTYKDSSLTYSIYSLVRSPISHIVRTKKDLKAGYALADRVIRLLQAEIPVALTTDAEKSAAKTLNYRIVEIHNYAGRSEDVIKVYQQMKKTFGADDELRGNFAAWYKSKGRKSDAIKEYEAFDNQIAGQSAIAYMHEKDGKWDLAIAIYENLEKIDMKDTGGWRTKIARCFQNSGRYKEAIGSYRLADKFPSGMFSMAYCHRKLKQYNEALSLYGQIIGAYPDKSGPSARFEMGRTYEQMDKKELAIRSYQRVCRDYPKSSTASSAHAHLQNKYKISVTLGGSKDE